MEMAPVDAPPKKDASELHGNVVKGPLFWIEKPEVGFTKWKHNSPCPIMAARRRNLITWPHSLFGSLMINLCSFLS